MNYLWFACHDHLKLSKLVIWESFLVAHLSYCTYGTASENKSSQLRLHESLYSNILIGRELLGCLLLIYSFQFRSAVCFSAAVCQHHDCFSQCQFHSSVELWPMMLTFKPDEQDESWCRMSRSEVSSFVTVSYCPLPHTPPTDCPTQPLKWSVNQCSLLSCMLSVGGRASAPSC